MKTHENNQRASLAISLGLSSVCVFTGESSRLTGCYECVIAQRLLRKGVELSKQPGVTHTLTGKRNRLEPLKNVTQANLYLNGDGGDGSVTVYAYDTHTFRRESFIEDPETKIKLPCHNCRGRNPVMR